MPIDNFTHYDINDNFPSKIILFECCLIIGLENIYKYTKIILFQRKWMAYLILKTSINAILTLPLLFLHKNLSAEMLHFPLDSIYIQLKISAFDIKMFKRKLYITRIPF